MHGSSDRDENSKQFWKRLNYVRMFNVREVVTLREVVMVSTYLYSLMSIDSALSISLLHYYHAPDCVLLYAVEIL